MKKYIAISAIAAIIIVSQSCEYHDLASGPALSDAELFQEVNASGYTYFRNGQLISGASASPHGTFRLRFNAIAWEALNANEELPESGNFPEGSVIVKEIHQGNTITVLAVMKKAKSDPNAGMGWLWAEYGSDGAPLYGLMKKGPVCTDCHGESPNRDLTRTFDLH